MSDHKNCVIDVGACVGLFIDDCLTRYDVENIFAFEPLPANYKFLDEKYRNDSRVTVLQQAVSNFSGKAQLYKKKYINRLFGFPISWRYDFAGNAGSSLQRTKSNVSQDHSTDVIVISLSDFILSRELTHVDILKIDSEGSEYDILHDLLDKGLTDRIDRIFFEDHVRKVPGLEADKKRLIERVLKMGVESKFYLQDVEAGDGLTYITMSQALERDFFKVV